MNIICLTGRITADIELKTTPSGVSVISFNIAVDRDYKVNGEKVTDFIPCVAWRGTAEFVEKYFRKGDMIAIVGALESRKYTDNNGNNRIVWEVKADKVNFCGGKKENTQIGCDGNGNDFEEVIGDDDLPF